MWETQPNQKDYKPLSPHLPLFQPSYMKAWFDAQHALETYRSLIYVSIAGFSALLLANLVGMGFSLCFETTKAPVAMFIYGIIFALVCFFGSYVTQFVIYNERTHPKNFHMVFVYATGAFSISSLIAFILGATLLIS